MQRIATLDRWSNIARPAKKAQCCIAVARIFGNITRHAGTGPAGIYAHSTRIGAAQDMIAHSLKIGEWR